MVLTAVGQICSTASMTHNLAQCQMLVRKAVAAGAKALFLPEASDYIASSPAESISLCLPAHRSPFVLGLQSSARQHALPINVGIHEPTSSPADTTSLTASSTPPDTATSGKTRIANTLIYIDATGTITQRYQKLHLFDVDLRPDGPLLKESASVEPGSSILPPFPTGTSVGLGKLGLTICFDIRFPEISLSLKRLGADTIVYPSAFTVRTGLAHWEVLLRARAVECQAWVLAAAQCGRHNGNRVSYGETIVVNPWGEVVGRLDRVVDIDQEVEGGREPELLVVDVDLGVGERIRREMPLKRRTDVYPEV